MRLSRRSAFGDTENPLTRALRGARAEGRGILDLTVSNPTRAGLSIDPRIAIGPLTNERAATYEPTASGTRAGREAVAALVGADPSRVILTASTSEAYALLLAVLCDPGDRVSSPQPSYPLLSHLATLSGVAISPYALSWDGRWHVDGESVERARLSGARAVLAVSPNNPTGSLLDDDDLAILDGTGLPVVVDEVFGAYPLEGEAGTTWSTERSRIVVGGLSKLAGLPQMKVGWIVLGGDERFASALGDRLRFANDAFLSLSTPSMLALPRWLETREAASEAIRARTRTNLAALRARLGADSPISVPTVEGGWYACLRLPRTRTDEEWALRLLDADDVLVQPGYLYDFEQDGWLVVSLLSEKSVFAEGAARLVARVESE